MGWKVVEWIHLADDREKWHFPVNSVTSIQVGWLEGYYLLMILEYIYCVAV
jgi:hypothetical protein